MNILYSFKFLLRQLYLSYFIPIAYIGLLIYASLGFYIYSLEGSPGNALTSSSTVVQIGAIAYLLLGVYNVRLSDKYDLKHLFSSIKSGYITHQMGSLLVGIISIFIIVICTFSFYLLVMWKYIYINPSFIVDVFLYISLYYGLAFLVCYLSGFMVATWIRGKFVFPLILLIYVLMTPLNFMFLRRSNNSFFACDKFLNVGEPNPTMAFHPLYGLSISHDQLAKQLLFICIPILLLFIYNVMHGFLQKNKYIIITFCLVLIFTISCLVSNLNGGQILLDNDAELHNYYKNYDITHSWEQQPYKINEMNISLDTKKNLSAEVWYSLIYEGQTATNELIFSLFHELKVKDVLIDKKQVNFNQNGDRLKIILNGAIERNEVLNISLKYEGLKTNFYFANEQAVYLPSYFNWLPSIYDKPSFIVLNESNLLQRVNHQLTQNVAYNLVFKHRGKEVYSNLPKTEKDEWAGKSFSGITLASGLLDVYTKNDTQWVIPFTWKDIVDDFPTLEADVQKLTSIINSSRLLPTEVSFPKKIFFLPNLNTVDRNEFQGTWYSQDHLILGTHVTVEYPEEYFTTYKNNFLVNIINSFFINNASLGEITDYQFAILYRAFLTDILLEQINIPSSEFQQLLESGQLQSDKHPIDDLVSQLNGFKNSTVSKDLSSSFYKEWAKLLHSNNPWESLKNLLEKVEDLN